MKKRIVYSLLLISFIIILDQITKYLVKTYMHPYQTIELLPFFNLVNVRNEGAAFGMFKSLGNTFFILISIAAIAFMLWVIKTGKEDHRIFALLAGGATGNLIDRLLYGKVIDFLDVFVKGYHWPAFNVADSALTIGIFLMFASMFRKK